jgi:hypothetical protein
MDATIWKSIMSAQVLLKPWDYVYTVHSDIGRSFGLTLFGIYDLDIYPRLSDVGCEVSFL